MRLVRVVTVVGAKQDANNNVRWLYRVQHLEFRKERRFDDVMTRLRSYGEIGSQGLDGGGEKA